MLARAVVEDAMAKFPLIPLPEDAVVAHFFCTYSDAAFASEVILRSLLHQLVQALPRTYSVINNRLQTQNGVNLSTETLWSASGDSGP